MDLIPNEYASNFITNWAANKFTVILNCDEFYVFMNTEKQTDKQELS